MNELDKRDWVDAVERLIFAARMWYLSDAQWNMPQLLSAVDGLRRIEQRTGDSSGCYYGPSPCPDLIGMGDDLWTPNPWNETANALMDRAREVAPWLDAKLESIHISSQSFETAPELRPLLDAARECGKLVYRMDQYRKHVRDTKRHGGSTPYG